MNSLAISLVELAVLIKTWGQELGLQQVGITDIDLNQAEQYLFKWLAAGYHGEMEYLARHGTRRTRPTELIPGTIRVISVRMDYLTLNQKLTEKSTQPLQAVIARYAWGRDYHKMLRKRLQKLAERIQNKISNCSLRVFVDSAPVLEKPLAEKAGLGWIGKHTNLINPHAGTWFFLGEIYTDLALPLDSPTINHCGSCRACLDQCPTQALVKPYQLDARRCISYLTIEYRGSISKELRPLIGNRIYGCDECLQACPWNRFAKPTTEIVFAPRFDFKQVDLLTFFNWDEQFFLKHTAGSALRRIGYECWLRNLAIALGNSPADSKIQQALRERMNYPSSLVQEHIVWALEQQLKNPVAPKCT